MSTPTFESLRSTLKNLRRRRSSLFILKQVSLFAIAAALLLLAASGFSAWMDLNKTGTTGLFVVTIALFAALLVWLVTRLRRLHTDDRVLAHYVEDHIPDLEQRLLTSLEFSDEDVRNGKAGVSKQFIQQLWQDAQEHVALQQRQVDTVAPARDSWLSFASALAVVAVVSAIFLTSEL